MRRRAGSSRQRLERRAHRGRVGVVGVVEEDARPTGGAASRRGATPAGARRPPRRIRRRKAHGEGDRRGGEKVRDLVRPGNGQADRRLAGGRREHGSGCPPASATTSRRRHLGCRRAARSGRPVPARRAAMAVDPRIVGVGDERPVRLQSLEDLGLRRRRSRRPSAKNSRCAGGDEQDRGDVGLERARERREVPRRRQPHLAHHPRRAPRQVHDRHRETDLAVLVARRLLDGEPAREDRGREVLGRRLARRARDRRQPEAASALHDAPRAAAAPRPARAPGPRESPPAGPRAAARRAARRAPRAAASRAKSWPSTRAPADRDEEIARPDAAASRRRRRSRTPAPSAACAARPPRRRSSSVKFTGAPRELRRDLAVVERDLRVADRPASSRGPCPR